MSVSFVRIDDRMIHGQTCTRWAREYPCDGLIAVNDKVGFRLGLRDACHWRHPRSQCRPFREPLLDERCAGGGSGGGWYRVLPCRCHVGFSAALQFRENHQRRARERSACFGRQRR